jgi:hypothetical protein
MKQLKFISLLCALMCIMAGVSYAGANAPSLSESKTLMVQPPGITGTGVAVSSIESIKIDETHNIEVREATGAIAIVNTAKTSSASVTCRSTEAPDAEIPPTRTLYSLRFSCMGSKYFSSGHKPPLSGRYSGAIKSPPNSASVSEKDYSSKGEKYHKALSSKTRLCGSANKA